MQERLLVSTRKGLFELERASRGFRVKETAFLGANVSLCLAPSGDDHEYVALDHGHFGAKLQRRRAGQPFEEAPRPAFPPRPEGTPDETTPDGKPLPWNVERIWALERGGPDTLWCGTIPGGLFVSRDRGESWELVRGLWDHPGRRQWFGGGAEYPGIHSICVDPRDADHVRVGVSCGGVWLTEDGGATWAPRSSGMRAGYMPPAQQSDEETQDPHRVVQCRAEPDTLWCQHHSGIFVSRDGARSWKEIVHAKPTNFGFAVAVHPKKPDTAWFVPATSDELRLAHEGRVVVSRTEDGGETFLVSSRGLPGTHAYDLVYRHALAVDETGEQLAFGSTSGGLWTSEDAGESWIELDARLPPIHAVCFAP